jgi:hypothetical protein
LQRDAAFAWQAMIPEECDLQAYVLWMERLVHSWINVELSYSGLLSFEETDAHDARSNLYSEERFDQCSTPMTENVSSYILSNH